MRARPLRKAAFRLAAVVFAVAGCAAGSATAPPSPSIAPLSPSPSLEANEAGANAPCACTCPPSATVNMVATLGSPAVPVAHVTLVGKPFFERATSDTDIRRCQGLVVAAETVTDGKFLSPNQCWDEGAVWWEDPTAWQSGQMSAAHDRWIELQLDGVYRLDEAIVQADNNDAYLVTYRDPATHEWLPLWTVPPAGSFGMATRPDPADDTRRQTLPKTVSADAVRLEAEFGDGMYAVSEVQLFGVRAP